jgi:hypothetical protein
VHHMGFTEIERAGESRSTLSGQTQLGLRPGRSYRRWPARDRLPLQATPFALTSFIWHLRRPPGRSTSGGSRTRRPSERVDEGKGQDAVGEQAGETARGEGIW